MIPMYYNLLDYFNSQSQPSTFHSQNTALTKYFQKYLLQKILGVLTIEGAPEEWDLDFVKNVLLLDGFFAIVDTPEFGVIPQPCTLSGRDIFYQPSTVIVTNPLLHSPIEKRIHEECALVKLQPNYGGVWDLISYYADQLSITSEAIGSNLINAKLAMVFAAQDKAQAESFKKMYDRLSSGEPAVFIDKKLKGVDGEVTWETFVQNLGQNYIGNTLLADLKAIENEFCSKVGIPNSNFQKQAHLLESEVQSNNADTQVLLKLWLSTMEKGLDDANKLFGLNLSCKAEFEEELKEDAYLEPGEEVETDESNN